MFLFEITENIPFFLKKKKLDPQRKNKGWRYQKEITQSNFNSSIFFFKLILNINQTHKNSIEKGLTVARKLQPLKKG